MTGKPSFLNQEAKADLSSVAFLSAEVSTKAEAKDDGRPQIPAGSLLPKTSGPHVKQYFVVIKYLPIKPVKVGRGQAYDVG